MNYSCICLQHRVDIAFIFFYIIKIYWGALPRPNPPRNSRSPVPGPISAFLSPGAGGPPGPRLYPARSSAGREPSLFPPVPVGLGLAVSGLGCRFKVDGTISGGKCKYARRYSIPSLVKYQ